MRMPHVLLTRAALPLLDSSPPTRPTPLSFPPLPFSLHPITAMIDPDEVLKYLAQCGHPGLTPPSTPTPDLVAEALAVPPPPTFTPDAVSSLYSYPIPLLSDDGQCSLSTSLSPTPFSLSSHILSLSTSSPTLLTHPLTLRLHRLSHLISSLSSLTHTDWLGVYQVTPPHPSTPPPSHSSLLKLAYRGEPSRPLFPLTDDFALISGNSRTAMRRVVSVIADTRRMEAGVPYYECSGRVRSEVCVPIVTPEGECVGIIDAESWKPGLASSDEVVWAVAATCMQLGRSSLIGPPLA